jgi:hypothetical protein
MSKWTGRIVKVGDVFKDMFKNRYRNGEKEHEKII